MALWKPKHVTAVFFLNILWNKIVLDYKFIYLY
jgi:hypothetical protein